MTEINKKRADNARFKRRSRARTRDAITLQFLTGTKTCDSANSRVRCRICGERIGFTTDNGFLVALDWGTLISHRHREA